MGRWEQDWRPPWVLGHGAGGVSMHLAQLDLFPRLRGREDTGVQNAGNSEGPTDNGTDLKVGGRSEVNAGWSARPHPSQITR